MSAPPDSWRDLELGEWIHDQLMPPFGLETEEWALGRVERASTRLQDQILSGRLYITEILWLAETTAFTAPGPYIYLSRHLLERLITDDAAAFIIAHEMAHHELGHFNAFVDLYPAIRATPVATIIAGILMNIDHLLHSYEHERAADEYALDICLTAGYNWPDCRGALEYLENYALDLRDIETVFGPDFGERATRTSHPPLRERMKYLDERAARWAS